MRYAIATLLYVCACVASSSDDIHEQIPNCTAQGLSCDWACAPTTDHPYLGGPCGECGQTFYVIDSAPEHRGCCKPTSDGTSLEFRVCP